MSQQLQSALVILRRRDLEQRIKLSRSTIYAKLDRRSPYYDPAFPKPIALGNGAAVGWVEVEVNDWLQGQIDAARKGA